LEVRVPARLSAAEGRKFALTVGAAFLVLAGVAWWRGRVVVAVIMGAVGVLLLSAALTIPAHLGPVYRAWMGFAAVLSKITTPIFMGLVYFIALTPIGVIRRLSGKNALVRPATKKSFWIPRAADAQRRVGMERQF
jgi:hypothetical protein